MKPPPPTSIGLRVVEELEAGIPLHTFARYLRAYERKSTYDQELKRLRERTGEAVDPLDSQHIGAMIEWLRSWRCRHLRRDDQGHTIRRVRAWASTWSASLPNSALSLTEIRDAKLRLAATVYGELSETKAAYRNLSAGRVEVRFGPTAAAKALYAIRPTVFPPWDDPIRETLGFAGNAEGYYWYLRLVARSIQALARQNNRDVRDLPRVLLRPNSTPPKLIDEFLWIRITRGLD